MVHEIDKSAVVTAVNEAYTQYAKTTEGQNASYIPYLKNIPPTASASRSEIRVTASV